VPASERFYAGGDTTVRGYALDSLTTPETRDTDGFPPGGNAVVIVNTELRTAVWKTVGAVGFLDIGNVFKTPSSFDVAELRGAIGFGLRYRSPIGPLRVDLGFKLHRDQISPDVREGLTALHISFGQAF
jgi:outer membrane translocation and assembly module TamA